MKIIVHLVLNILLLAGSFVPFGLAVLLIIYRTRSVVERMIRGLALFAGTLLALGADAAGITFAQSTVNILSKTGFAGLVIKVAWAAATVSVGFIVGKYLTTKLKTSPNIAIRGMIFIGMVVHIELLEIYIDAVRQNGFTVGPAAIPVAGFLIGMIAYIVFNYDPQDPQQRISAVLHDLWWSRSPDGRPSHPETPLPPPPADQTAPMADPQEPFETGPYTDYFPEQP